MSQPYVTAPEDVRCTGWAKLGEVWLSVEPLRDARTGGFAHLTYAGALAAVAELGGELPSREDVLALHRAAVDKRAVELVPVTLPDLAMLQRVGMIAGSARARAFADANMATLAWCCLHDDRVNEQLQNLGWDGVTAVANAGKHWIAPAAPGMGRIAGWWIGGRAGHLIQQGTRDVHLDTYSDYATTTLVKRTTMPEAP